jgi:hypothetical protein
LPTPRRMVLHSVVALPLLATADIGQSVRTELSLWGQVRARVESAR